MYNNNINNICNTYIRILKLLENAISGQLADAFNISFSKSISHCTNCCQGCSCMLKEFKIGWLNLLPDITIIYL